jgi:hypothetical protein
LLSKAVHDYGSLRENGRRSQRDNLSEKIDLWNIDIAAGCRRNKTRALSLISALPVNGWVSVPELTGFPTTNLNLKKPLPVR